MKIKRIVRLDRLGTRQHKEDYPTAQTKYHIRSVLLFKQVTRLASAPSGAADADDDADAVGGEEGWSRERELAQVDDIDDVGDGNVRDDV